MTERPLMLNLCEGLGSLQDTVGPPGRALPFLVYGAIRLRQSNCSDAELFSMMYAAELEVALGVPVPEGLFEGGGWIVLYGSLARLLFNLLRESGGPIPGPMAWLAGYFLIRCEDGDDYETDDETVNRRVARWLRTQKPVNVRGSG